MRVESENDQNINASFRFHAVGQGLFYSGLLNSFRNNRHCVFSFVYDCGSFSDKRFLYAEIDDFKALLPQASGKKRLDLLIVSHLHDDHISGLEYLLEGLDVETVVMPYMDEGLRLLVRLESQNTEAFLQSFLLDPISWLHSKGIQRIVLIGVPPEDSLCTTEEYKGVNFFQDETAPLHWDRSAILRYDTYDGTQVLFAKNASVARANTFSWSFSFLNLPLKGQRVYRSQLKEYLEQNCVTLEQVFCSKRLTNGLKRRLREACSDISINRTSVMLSHEPYIHNSEKKDMSDPTCTLLTGDMELSKKDILKYPDNADPSSFFAWPYGREGLLVFQIPHHGAFCNRVYSLNDCPPPLRVAVISCGITNRYGHPHPETIRCFRKRSDWLVEVNERQSYDYHIFLSQDRTGQRITTTTLWRGTHFYG